MKFAKYGSILKLIHKREHLCEEELRTIMAQLILAVDLMHRKNIIHRDIKPDNILVMDREKLQVSISDLGLACKADDDIETMMKCGTPGYVAPEILKGFKCTPKADIFALGSLFFNLLTQSNLFNANNAKDMLV